MTIKNNKSIISIGDAAKLLNVSIMTLRRWDATGKLRALKSSGGHRYYEREVIEYFGKDLFGLATTWTSSEVAPEISDSCYSGTQDSFRARLGHMAEVINAGPRMSGSAALVTALAGEIGNNSFDHNLGSWPDIPGIFFAYDVNKKIIVLADRGLGIKATLLRVRPELKDDLEALEVALTEHVSGRAPEQRGNGLKFVVDVAMEYPIRISLQSGTAIAIIDKEIGLSIKLAYRNIRGVLARIEY
jgi:excisionase family DNA binding protein